MIPKGSEAIEHLISAISLGPMTNTNDVYTLADLNLLCEVLNLIKTDYDRAADTFVSEHQSLSKIFAAALQYLEGRPLKERLAHALDDPCPNLRISNLTAQSDKDLEILIDLHEVVEAALLDGADWAEEINALIWRFLDEYSDHRSYRTINLG